MKARLPRGSIANHGAVRNRRLPPWANLVGRLAFGVAAPLVCFGALLAAAPDLWLWPMALFVLTCVAAYVTSWLRAPRDDAFDAALHGAMSAATAFGGVWGVSAGLLTLLLIELAVFVGSANFELIPWLAFGATGPCGFVAYLWRLRDRWPRRARERTTTRARTFERLAGFLGPGVVCLALFAVIETRANAVERRVIEGAVAGDLQALRVWRWIAPGRYWSEIVDAHGRAFDAARRARLARAYDALTGRQIPYGERDSL